VNLPLGAPGRNISRQAVAAPPVDCVGSYSNSSMEYLITVGDDGGLYLLNGDEVIARLAFYDELIFALQDLTSGQELHCGRFRRDPITRQIEQLQIGGRLARRHRAPAVPEPRSAAESLSRRSA
jgi:hypothetical protein